MNKDEIKKLLDKTNIYVLDEINILEYIDELEKIKEEYTKSLDKLDELDNRIDKAIKYLKDNACYENTISELFCDDLDTDSCMELLDILRGDK